ncbi:hypothetical protein [Larkinella terrae]|uniref:Uncharacterized protein n=1 Tax=Larkinella terrae TaxID=2025311 RepID=A0A7K0EIZ2_9BACT|nr:hypothetical protein [Larkinella terrae]MRS61809.1 hypothetical protein [Larkinella terrae]
MRSTSQFDFSRVPVKNLTLEQAITATLDAALTALGQIGYDTTLQRLKLYDGTTVRTLLQSNDISGSSLATAVTNGDKLVSPSAIKTYIDAVAAAGTNPITDFDASGGSFPSGATLADRYRVTVAGTVQGIVLQVGDMVLPKVTSPGTSNAADWFAVQGNVDAASTSVLGLVILASLAQIQGNSGGDANKVVTVATLNSWESALGRVRKYSTSTNLTNGTVGITHNLNSSTPVVQVYDSAGPILVDWTVSSANAVNLTSSVAVSSVTVVVLA